LSKLRQNAPAKEYKPLRETEMKSIVYNLESEKGKHGSASDHTKTDIRNLDKQLSGY